MTPGPRTHKSASLRIAIPQGVPEHMRHGMREIVALQSTALREGDAGRLMGRVCAEADRAGFVLMLEVKPFADGEMGEAELRAWYGCRFGFAVIQEAPVILMARSPRQ